MQHIKYNKFYYFPEKEGFWFSDIDKVVFREDSI